MVDNISEEMAFAVHNLGLDNCICDDCIAFRCRVLMKPLVPEDASVCNNMINSLEERSKFTGLVGTSERDYYEDVGDEDHFVPCYELLQQWYEEAGIPEPPVTGVDDGNDWLAQYNHHLFIACNHNNLKRKREEGEESEMSSACDKKFKAVAGFVPEVDSWAVFSDTTVCRNDNGSYYGKIPDPPALAGYLDDTDEMQP